VRNAHSTTAILDLFGRIQLAIHLAEIKHIRNIQPNMRIIVVVASRTDLKEQAMAAGADVMLARPDLYHDAAKALLSRQRGHVARHPG